MLIEAPALADPFLTNRPKGPRRASNSRFVPLAEAAATRLVFGTSMKKPLSAPARSSPSLRFSVSDAFAFSVPEALTPTMLERKEGSPASARLRLNGREIETLVPYEKLKKTVPVEASKDVIGGPVLRPSATLICDSSAWIEPLGLAMIASIRLLSEAARSTSSDTLRSMSGSFVSRTDAIAPPAPPVPCIARRKSISACRPWITSVNVMSLKRSRMLETSGPVKLIARRFPRTLTPVDPVSATLPVPSIATVMDAAVPPADSNRASAAFIALWSADWYCARVVKPVVSDARTKPTASMPPCEITNLTSSVRTPFDGATVPSVVAVPLSARPAAPNPSGSEVVGGESSQSGLEALTWRKALITPESPLSAPAGVNCTLMPKPPPRRPEMKPVVGFPLRSTPAAAAS